MMRGAPVRPRVLLFALAAVLTLTLLGPLMTFSGLPMTGEGSPVRQSLYPVILLLVLYGIRARTDPSRLLAVPLPLVVALIWCWLSVGWSIAPDVAVRRVVLTSVVIWSIFMLVRQLGYERVVPVLRVALLLGLVANYFAVLGFPVIGIHQANEPDDLKLIGDWRGIMMHKNIAGAVCALTVLAYTFDPDRIPKAVRAAVIGAALLFLIKSGSRTSVGLCVAAVMVGLLYVRYHARYRLLVLGGLCLVACIGAIMLSIYHNPFNGVLTDESAFTGRMKIWQALSAYVADHPLTGTGYGSFWNIGKDSPIFVYGQGWITEIASGHNGFLDVATQIGLPGLLLVVFGTVVWPFLRLFRSPGATGPRGALIFSIMLFCVTHNFTESSLFDRDQLCQVFLMIGIAMLMSVTEAARLRPARSVPFALWREAEESGAVVRGGVRAGAEAALRGREGGTFG